MRPYLWQAGMAPSEVGEVNVFRRFSSDVAGPMRTFYADLLELAPLPAQPSGGGQMIRHPVGTSEVKLFPVAPSAPSQDAVTDRIGVAVLTFFYRDRGLLESRFTSHGFEVPEFRADANGKAVAFVRDPDGEWVELVVVPDATADALERFEIGLGTADLGATRAFYRDLMGLDEAGPVHDPLLGVDKYTYRHRDLTLNVWGVDPSSPRDAETAGMQYIVWNVEAINEVAEARGADIDRPLSEPGTMRTVWLRDPNGVSNYFAEFAGHDDSPPN